MNLGQFSTPSPPYLPTISTFHWPVNWAINPSGSPQLSQPSDWDWCTAKWKRMHCVIHCDALCGGRIVSKSSHHKVGTQLGLVEFAAMLWINTVYRTNFWGWTKGSALRVRSTQMPRAWSQPLLSLTLLLRQLVFKKTMYYSHPPKTTPKRSKSIKKIGVLRDTARAPQPPTNPQQGIE